MSVFYFSVYAEFIVHFRTDNFKYSTEPSYYGGPKSVMAIYFISGIVLTDLDISIVALET